MVSKWWDLLFLHLPVDPALVQPLIPPGLTLDLYPDETGEPRAWIGLVPFRMTAVRPVWSPELPWLSSFPETNVRTYVHREGRDPGVWFFSLDAARWIGCKAARTFFSLPYWHARMSVARTGDEISYRSRRWEGPPASSDVQARLGDPLGIAAPNTLEFFLIERYLLYSVRRGRLYSGRVWHEPYPLRSAVLLACEESLIEAAGVPQLPFTHFVFSEAVDVLIYPIQLANTAGSIPAQPGTTRS